MQHLSRRNLGQMSVPQLCIALGHSMTSNDRGYYPSPQIDALQIDFDAALTRAVQQELVQQGRLVSEAELAGCVFEAAEEIAADVQAAFEKRKAAPSVRSSIKPVALPKRVTQPIKTRPVTRRRRSLRPRACPHAQRSRLRHAGRYPGPAARAGRSRPTDAPQAQGT